MRCGLWSKAMFLAIRMFMDDESPYLHKEGALKMHTFIKTLSVTIFISFFSSVASANDSKDFVGSYGALNPLDGQYETYAVVYTSRDGSKTLNVKFDGACTATFKKNKQNNPEASCAKGRGRSQVFYTAELYFKKNLPVLKYSASEYGDEENGFGGATEYYKIP